MTFEIYGDCSEKFEERFHILKKMVKTASEVNHVPCSVLNCAFFSYSSNFNARFITRVYLVIFDSGGGNLEDFSSARAFEMLQA